jgi:hypothetical protein
MGVDRLVGELIDEVALPVRDVAPAVAELATPMPYPTFASALIDAALPGSVGR